MITKRELIISLQNLIVEIEEGKDAQCLIKAWLKRAKADALVGADDMWGPHHIDLKETVR